ncbi:MAG: phospholipid carrier-dependent glycosyltransferase [Candidatus Chisholmbacteria bacterium]|nr:phospholipid carrier-dependent glycosyltransferase [Candidatus Chisholmbacteria bacterium]
MTRQLLNHWWLFFIVLISGVKLVNLELVPLFGDEAAYCFWGTKVSHFGLVNSWEAMVSQGKIAPVLPFLQSIAWLVLPQLRPVFLCRGVSVILSAATSFLVFWLTLKLSRRPLVGWAAMLFYLLNPFSFFTDRTSLLEPALNFFVLVVTSLVWLAVTRKQLKLLLFGVIFLLVAVLTKLTALLIIPGLMGIVWFSPLRLKQRWLVLGGLFLASLGLWWLVNFIGQWAVFGYHAHTGFELSGMMRRSASNLYLTRSWYEQYLTAGFFIVTLLGAWRLFKERQYGWLIFPIPMVVTYILLADSYFPRFLLLTLPFLAVMVGYAVRTRVGQVILAIMLVIWMANDWQMIVRPAQARMAREDHWQFFEDWTSGVGTKAASEWLTQKGPVGIVVLPEDLLYRMEIHSLENKIKQNFSFLPIRDEDDLKKKMKAGALDDAILLTTTHHGWLQATFGSQYSLQPVYASHGDTARSVLGYILLKID